jgi:DNA polymerase-1
MATAKTLLIDGDILLFKFGFRHQKTFKWANGTESVSIDEDRAKFDVDAFIRDLKLSTRCHDHIVCFTSKLNFRYKVLPTYKHNRVKNTPPILIKIIKDHLRFNHPNKSTDWLEADDLMGILGSRHPDRYVLATIDKDFLSIPCTLFLWNKTWLFPHRISEDEADLQFHTQWLTGDSTDGYSGLKRVGAKGAEKILGDLDPSEYTDACLEAYMDRCYTYNECLQQARMARILRHTDWDFKKEEVILWEPS